MKLPSSRTENIVVQETDKELLIYDLLTNQAFCLNETSALVWQNCDGTKEILQIARTVGKQLGCEVTDELILLAIEGLKKENLIEAATTPTNFNRREVIKRIGLGSSIALPIIFSVSAPTAIAAQSVSCTTTCICAVSAFGGTIGSICPTTVDFPPLNGTPCPPSPDGCSVCRQTSPGTGVPGVCRTS